MFRIQLNSAADLVRHECRLMIECTCCGAATTLNGLDVLRLCGPVNLHALRSRLECDQCGLKAIELVVLPPL